MGIQIVGLTVAAWVLLGSAGASGHDLWGLGHKSTSLNNTINTGIIVLADQLHDPEARYIYSRLLLWRPGQKLSGCFFNGTAKEKSFLIETAESLLKDKGVNISFEFSSPPAFQSCQDRDTVADVRVSFTDGCCAAYIGRISHHPEVKEGPSVFLSGVMSHDDTKARQIVMHELGHVLGLNHEHQSPSSLCGSEFNKEKILQAYNWSEADFETNLRELDSDSHSYKWSFFDRGSIMKYFLDPLFLKKGIVSPCYSAESYQPSDGDYEGLRDAYPVTHNVITKQKTREGYGTIETIEVSPPVKSLINELRKLDSDGD